jgi:hypothetical protein
VVRVAVGVAAIALVVAGDADAHQPDTAIPTGYVATVSGIQPNVVGLGVTVVLGDQVLVRNLTRGPVMILDRRGRPFIRVAAGRSRAWHDVRVVETGPPPPARPGADSAEPRFVKNWRIPGRAGTRPFAISGFLGWAPPDQSGSGGGTPLAVWVGGATFLLALSVGAVWLLGRGRAES